MTDDLLIKYLLKETSTEEELVVKTWINLSEANQKRFSEFELIWSTSKNLAASSNIDENDAWDRFQLRVEDKSIKSRSISNRFIWMKVAAIFLLIAGSWLAYTTLVNSGFTTLAATETVRNETLPDGTEITMNKNSELAFESGFKGSERSVLLKKGEVFFNVSKDKTKPFIIEADDVRIRVIGTSFNVKRSSHQTEILVETGIVQVVKGKSRVELHKGEMVVVSDNAEMNIKPVTDNLHNYYRNNEFVAVNTPLWRMVEVLNEAYNANIQIENQKIRNLTLTTTFKDESLDNNLKIITETLNIKAIKSEGKIILQ